MGLMIKVVPSENGNAGLMTSAPSKTQSFKVTVQEQLSYFTPFNLISVKSDISPDILPLPGSHREKVPSS